MWRPVLLALVLTAGCAAPSASWDEGVPSIRPLGEIRGHQGLLIVRTFEMGGRAAEADMYHRGFQVLDPDGHMVHREPGFDDDWASVRLFPGRYLVLSFVGDGLFDRHWEKAQVEVEAGKLTAVDFLSPGPRETLP
jgi:hypothetical protein